MTRRRIGFDGKPRLFLVRARVTRHWSATREVWLLATYEEPALFERYARPCSGRGSACDRVRTRDGVPETFHDFDVRARRSQR